MKRDRRQVMAAMAATTTLAGLSTYTTFNPAAGRSRIDGLNSVEDGIELGRREHPKLVEKFGGEYEHRRLQGYVDQVGKRLARGTEYGQFPYRFTLLNTPIVNAFALPGGYVYVSRGLLALAGNEAEMAGVLAHELGHVNAGHTVGRLSRLPREIAQIGQSIAATAIQGYSRRQEFDANILGVRYLSRAGYDPNAMVTFSETLRELSIVEAKMRGLPPGNVDAYSMMSTHPRTVDRVRKAMRAAKAARPKKPMIGRDTYLAQIDGMLFGDDPTLGVVRGTLIQHPAMRFEFRVPDGFHILNGPNEIVARDKGGAGIVFDIALVKRSRDLAAYLRNEWTLDTRPGDVERIDVDGMDAATGWVRTRDGRHGTVDLRAVAIRRDADSVYRFLFVNAARDTARLAPAFRRTTHSFRRLSVAEAVRIKPLRLVMRTVRRGDTIYSLARNLPYGRHNVSWFRVLNAMKPGEILKPNRRLKVVVA